MLLLFAVCIIQFQIQVCVCDVDVDFDVEFDLDIDFDFASGNLQLATCNLTCNLHLGGCSLQIALFACRVFQFF